MTLNPFELNHNEDVCNTLHTRKINPGIFQLSAGKTSHFCHMFNAIGNINQVISLIALIRPSCMDVKIDDGKTIAEHYVMRVNGDEEVTYLHPKLEPILKDTYGFALFQEQNIRITSDVAGFSLVEADLMRMAIGKKDFAKMEQMHQKFIDGCKIHSGIEPEAAEAIFQQIRAAARYQFNASHATSYGMIAYADLYMRYHNPCLFFATKLAYTEINISDKQKKTKQLKDLIRSAKERDIDVHLPNLHRRNVHADFMPAANLVYFGFNNIAGTGPEAWRKVFEKMKKIEDKMNKLITDCTWLEVLLYFSKDIGKKPMEQMIRLGMFDHISTNRRGLLHDYNDWITIQESKVAAKWCVDNQQGTFRNTLKALAEAPVGRNVGHSNAEQKKKFQTLYEMSVTNRPKETNSEWIIQNEETILGVALTSFDFKGTKLELANAKLSDLDKPMKDAIIAVYVKETSIKPQKDGRNMMFVTASDSDGMESGSILLFADPFIKHGEKVYSGGSYIFYGSISDRGSFLVNNVEHLTEGV